MAKGGASKLKRKMIEDEKIEKIDKKEAGLAGRCQQVLRGKGLGNLALQAAARILWPLLCSVLRTQEADLAPSGWHIVVRRPQQKKSNGG